MDSLSSASQEEPLRDSPTPIEATPNPIDAGSHERAGRPEKSQPKTQRTVGQCAASES